MAKIVQRFALTAFIRLEIFSFLTAAELYTKIAVLDTNVRKRLLNSPGLFTF
jgi:hypothetical protein